MAEWLLVLVMATSTGNVTAHKVADFTSVKDCTDAMLSLIHI